MIIPGWLFDGRKTFSVRFPYSPLNEKFSKVFMRKVEKSTNDKVTVIITQNTRKIQSLFNNKDKVKHYSCVIYRVICSCSADYFVETIRSSELRWNEHITGKYKNLDCVKHLNDYFDHEFRWVFLSCASKNCLKRKRLEVHDIKRCEPSLHNQVNSYVLNLFKNGVTLPVLYLMHHFKLCANKTYQKVQLK